jgi:hypothetical protein
MCGAGWSVTSLILYVRDSVILEFIWKHATSAMAWAELTASQC